MILKMNHNFISIIVPTYNRPTLLYQTLLSVMNQNYDNYEIIVIDDCSSKMNNNDNKILINKINDKRIKYYHLLTNRGHSYARNFGIQHTSYNWIKYLDDDNTINNDCLLIINDNLNDNKLVYTGKYELMNSDTGESTIKGNDFSKINIFDSYQFDTCSIIHHKSCVNEIGGWNTFFKRMADDEFILRYVTNYYDKYKFINDIVGKYNVRTSISRVTTNEGNFVYAKKIKSIFKIQYDYKKCLIITNSQFRLQLLLNNNYDSKNFIDSDINITFHHKLLYDFIHMIYDDTLLSIINQNKNNYQFIMFYFDDDINIINQLFNQIHKNNYLIISNSIMINVSNNQWIIDLIKSKHYDKILSTVNNN